MRDIRAMLARDYERHEGVRPIQIFMMLVGYLLFPIVATPWGYVARTFVRPGRATRPGVAARRALDIT